MLLYALDLFGTAVFAVSGALAAGRQRMDIFGVVVVGGVTAVGGGTLRDLLLDRSPIFWIDDPVYLGVIAGSALLTFLYTQWFRAPHMSLRVADAFGLAVFAVVGSEVAHAEGASTVIIIIMAMITGTVGGMIRDVLCSRVPLILREEIYATAVLAGALLYVLLLPILNEQWLLPLVAFTVFACRIAAIRWQLRLPSYHVESDKP